MKYKYPTLSLCFVLLTTLTGFAQDGANCTSEKPCVFEKGSEILIFQKGSEITVDIDKAREKYNNRSKDEHDVDIPRGERHDFSEGSKQIERKFQEHAQQRTREFWINNQGILKKISTSASKSTLKGLLGFVSQGYVIGQAIDMFWSNSIALDPQEKLMLQWDVESINSEIDFLTLSISYYNVATFEERNKMDKLWLEARYRELNDMSNSLYEKKDDVTKESHDYIREGSSPPKNDMPPSWNIN